MAGDEAAGASAAWRLAPRGGPPRWGRRQWAIAAAAFAPLVAFAIAAAVFGHGSHGAARRVVKVPEGRFLMAVVEDRGAAPCKPGTLVAPQPSSYPDQHPCLTLGPTLVSNRNVLDVQTESFVTSKYAQRWLVVVHVTKAALIGLVVQAGSDRGVAVVLDGTVLSTLPLGSLGAVRELRVNQLLVTESEADKISQRIWGYPAGCVDCRHP